MRRPMRPASRRA